MMKSRAFPLPSLPVSRRPLLPLALALCVALFEAGCSSLPPHESTQDYALTRSPAEASAFQVIDARPQEDLRPANEQAGYRVDNRMLNPAPAEFLASELERAVAGATDPAQARAALAGRKIVLKHFAVLEIPYDSIGRTSSGMPPSEARTPANMVAGGVAIGLMGLAVMALDHMHGTREVRVEISVEVDGQRFENIGWGTGQTVPSSDATLRPAADCVAGLVTRITEGRTTTGAVEPAPDTGRDSDG